MGGAPGRRPDMLSSETEQVCSWLLTGQQAAIVYWLAKQTLMNRVQWCLHTPLSRGQDFR